MSSYAPVAAFAALACGTVAALVAFRRRRRRAHSLSLLRARCSEEYCSGNGYCETGLAYCSPCGAGPLTLEDIYIYPVYFNHIRALACRRCAESARKRWGM
jgi:hypothetical protein